MVNHKHHKVFIGVVSVVILIIGLFLGFLLASKLDTIDLEIINLGLAFTSIILLLIVGGLVLEVRELLQFQSVKGKK